MEQQEIISSSLADLQNGNTGVITKVSGHGAFRKRITEMGFVKGKVVTVIKNAPLQDPIEYEIMGYRVSLRRSEARFIQVQPETDDDSQFDIPFAGTVFDGGQKVSSKEKCDVITVALVGNPNSGKTTLFNLASGMHEHVGNYSGVTIDAKEGKVREDGYLIKLTDLPGTYSITEYTPEELFVRQHIIETMPDVVVNVVDASNLERNLFLTTQLIDMNIKVVIALNMFDELEQSGAHLNYHDLAAMIGIPIIPMVAVHGKGLHELIAKVIDVYEDRDPIVRHIHINYGKDIEDAMIRIQSMLKANPEIADAFSTRYLAIKLLEHDKTTMRALASYKNYRSIVDVANAEIFKLEKEYGERSETIITDAKYGFIAGALNETFTENKIEERKKNREIDNIMTHRLFGFPIFFLFMWLMFQATFTLGSYPMNWLNTGVGMLGTFIETVMPAGTLKDLLVHGVIGGVGGVIVFLPNILILFFFISLMEDTGYMARVSFIMDRLMHKVGLHGKSFIPLLMGFGCNVPAIMATRTLENRKDRILTILITPFMSCSARLPVYVLLISAFFPRHQGLVLLSIYAVGIVLAIGSALVLKKIFFAKQDAPFVMELPPYRIPTIRNTTVHMWFKGAQYLRKMGGVILSASILIWALSYYPRNVHYSMNYDAAAERLTATAGMADAVKNEQLRELALKKESERTEQSYIGRMGHFIEPAIRPLGFDWKIGICILTGSAAKEIVVSSMGILYQADLNAKENSGRLVEKLQKQEYTNGIHQGEKVFSPLIAYCMMLFVLIYFPCIATIAAVRKEANWTWALFTMTYTTGIAYFVSFCVYQLGSTVF
ncbi:MAG TPA: ferrous iron transport protein B [Bacteroidota bacterium]|nr:ferrous iron transport protein B [Bacteroidota bacterium]